MQRSLAPLALMVLLGAVFPGQRRLAATGRDRMLRGSHSGYMMVNLSTGQAHVVTQGEVIPLGSTTLEQDLQLVSAGPGTMSFAGTWTITVGSGGQLFGSSEGTSTALDTTHRRSVGHCASTGGTGRLADARAAFDVVAEVTVLSVDGDLASQAIEITADGRLSGCAVAERSPR